MVTMYQTMLITDKGYKDTQGGYTNSPAEAARINQEAQDIMDGKKDIEWGENLTQEDFDYLDSL